MSFPDLNKKNESIFGKIKKNEKNKTTGIGALSAAYCV
jgi:hypothetical protein